MNTFTIFTSAYNAASTLYRVYNSLLKQTFKDFEWLVIDDGSTDNTSEVIQEWVKESKIPIRFYSQDNMHKFYSLMRGIELANSIFFLIADADDEFRADTLSIFHETYESIPRDKRDKILGVNCLCQDAHGEIVGDPYPINGMLSDHNEMYYKYKVKGEKWGMQLASILKKFTFPKEYFNNGYIPEGILWSRIAEAGYKIVFINEALRIYHNDHNRTSISTTGKENLKKNSFGSMQSIRAELNSQLKYFRYNPLQFIKSIILYHEAAKLQEKSPAEAAKELRGIARFMYWGLYPVSVLIAGKRKSSTMQRT